MLAKYHYSNANKVYEQDKSKHPCFAYLSYRPQPYFYLKPVMNKEDTNNWLTLIQKFKPFTWKWEEDFIKVNIPYDAKEKHFYTFVILFGNLVKGCTEYAWYCEDHLKDTTNLPFFEKNWKAFVAKKDERMNVNYNDKHGWFTWKDAEEKTYPRKSKTLQEVLSNFKINVPYAGQVWKTCL